MAISKYQGVKITSNKTEQVEDSLSIESPLNVILNGKQYMVTMSTPGNEIDLVRGILHSEDIYRGPNEHITIKEYDTTSLGFVKSVAVNIKPEFLGDGYKNARNILSVSSCGVCGKPELDELSGSAIKKGDIKFSLQDIGKMFNTMESHQEQFSQSGGIHAAAVFNSNKELLVIKEDIGRHNAVDKVVGHLLHQNKLDQAKIVLVSGRVSYEIISKAFAARIPLLAAVSAPSSLAVDYAKELGITLLGFCRPGRFTVYSNLGRILHK